MNTIAVIPGVTQIIDRRANIFIIAEDKLTLIDAGLRGSAPLILDVIRRLGRSPEELKLLVLTHNHLDHSGAAAELRKTTGCKIAARLADFSIKGDEIPYPGGRYIAKVLKSPFMASLRRRLLLGEDSIDIPLEDSQVLPALGGLRVIFTPGHTPGSISLYAPTRQILFVGDALNKRNGMPLRSVTLNLKAAAASVLTMAELDVVTLCFGHGKPIKVGGDIYLRNLAGKIKRKY